MEHVRSLAETHAEETVSVRRIVFDGVRARCADLGLAEGAAVRVDGQAGGCVLVHAADGAQVCCPAELARFVEVDGDGTI